MNVQLNWIPGRPELENENLLSAFGISLAIDRSKSRRISSFPFLWYVYLFLTLDFFRDSQGKFTSKKSGTHEEI